MASLVYLSAPPALAGSGTVGSEGSQAFAPAGTGSPPGRGESQLRPRPRTNTPTRTATRTPTRTPTPMNTPTNTPTNTPIPSCGLAWRNVSSPGPATALYGIEVVSANNI